MLDFGCVLGHAGIDDGWWKETDELFLRTLADGTRDKVLKFGRCERPVCGVESWVRVWVLWERFWGELYLGCGDGERDSKVARARTQHEMVRHKLRSKRT